MGNCAGFCQAEGGTDSNEHQMRQSFSAANGGASTYQNKDFEDQFDQ